MWPSNGVSFTVGRGEIFGLLGPNGAGKTTTILMMLGLTDITSGSVSVLGYDPAREPLAVKRLIGYLPDTVGFYDHMTASRQPAATPRALIGIRARRAREAHRRRARSASASPTVADKRSTRSRAACGSGSGLAEILMKRRADRDPRRADLRARSAGDRRVAGHDPRASSATASAVLLVLASARAGAERLRPRRAVQRRPHRARSARCARARRARCSAAAIAVEVEADGGRARRNARRPCRA